MYYVLCTNLHMCVGIYVQVHTHAWAHTHFLSGILVVHWTLQKPVVFLKKQIQLLVPISSSDISDDNFSDDGS